MGIFKGKNKGNQENTKIDYRKNKIKYVQILGFWVKSAIKTKSKTAYINILDFDKNLTNPKQWFEVALFLQDCLLFLIEETDLDGSLTISLSQSDKPTNIENIDYSYIQENISNPPILFLSPAMKKAENCFIENLSKELKKNVYYSEVLGENGYSRIVFISKF